MSEGNQANTSENNVHFIDIPTQSDNSQFTFTIRYSTKPKSAETEEVPKKEEEIQEALVEDIVAEANKKVSKKEDLALFNTSMLLVSVVISTVMMMAAKMSNIPHNYLVWTEKYLKCCKDRNGEHPPNVQSILDILQEDPDFVFLDIPDCKCPSFFYKRQ